MRKIKLVAKLFVWLMAIIGTFGTFCVGLFVFCPDNMIASDYDADAMQLRAKVRRFFRMS